MSNKIAIIAIGTLFITTSVFAKLPTQQELDKDFVQIRLKVDSDIHNFYWKRIESFDDDGVMIHYQIRHEDKTIEDKYNFIPKEDILNFEESRQKFLNLKEQ